MNDQNLSVGPLKASVNWITVENASEPWLIIDDGGNLKYLDLKAGLASTDFQAVSLARAINAAILAEREACAKICFESELLIPISEWQKGSRHISALTAQGLGHLIRARSNAPESPNKALESSENLQSSTFPASVLKTCS